MEGVEDGERTGGYHAAGRVDVERDGLVGVIGLEPEELRDDRGGGVVVYRAVKAYYPFLRRCQLQATILPHPPPKGYVRPMNWTVLTCSSFEKMSAAGEG